MFKAILIVIIIATGQVNGPMQSKPSFETQAACETWVGEVKADVMKEVEAVFGANVAAVSITCEKVAE
jgi:hypothetical protein